MKSFLLTIRNMFYLISYASKKTFYAIFGLSVLISFLELLGLGILIPLIFFLIDPNSLANTAFLNNIFFSNYDLSIIKFSEFNIAVILISFFFLKNIFQIYLTYLSNKLIFRNQNFFSLSLYKKYLLSNYSIFKKKHSSELLRNVIHQAAELSSKIINPFLLIFREILLITIIVIFFLITNFNTTIFVLFFFVILTIFYIKISRRYLQKLGEKMQILTVKRLKNFQNSISLLKEIKIYQKINFFLNRFHNLNIVDANYGIKSSIIKILPRSYFEIIAVLTVSIFFLIYIDLNDRSTISSLVAFLFIAGYKLLPSSNRIVNSFQTIMLYSAVTFNLKKEIQKNIEKENKTIIKFNKSIIFKKIDFSYSNNNKIFNKTDFEIKKNCIIGIFGPSGSGKSTLFDIIFNLVNSEYQILIDDLEFNKKNFESKTFKFGYVPPKVFLTDETLFENIAIAEDDNKINKTKVFESSKIANCYNFCTELNKSFDTKIGEYGSTLSTGQVQRIGIARALYNEPDILIMDEATNSLDKEAQKKVFDNLKEKNLTIVFCSHDQSLLKYCDYYYKLENSKLILS